MITSSPIRYTVFAVTVVLAASALGAAARSAPCGNGPAGFDRWLQQFRTEAARQGISATVLDQALSGVSYDQKIIRLDRSQHSFKLSFEQFYARRVSGALISRGRTLMARHRGLLDRVEQKFGVPAPVLIAIWGLETNYGADRGMSRPIFRSLATLAYDCRRSEFFTGQLVSALRVVERGDMAASELRGGWAGEIGQTQFLPTAYFNHAVDYDGDRRRDLIKSVPDLLASTANFLKAHGWQRGLGWSPGSANYAVLAEWNKAQVYQRTIAAMADRLSR